jgi:tRNA/tmRNA/rRNA uracil-C5-methylase (TrmA/RlmC/RlmD family)
MGALEALAGSLSALERPTVSEIELSENVIGSERAVHLELVPDADPSRLAALSQVDGLAGASCAPVDHPRTMELWGSPYVRDRIGGASLTRHARSFFQANRFLLEPLVNHVLGLIDGGPILDLYAGVGLFSVAAAAGGKGSVVAVEGDRFSADDLRRNAAGHDITTVAGSVEDFLRRPGPTFRTLIVDPPRTGMSKTATAGVVARGASRVVYVSCDIATLARDGRQLIDAGYRIEQLRGFDLFPNTAHVETVISFAR